MRSLIRKLDPSGDLLGTLRLCCGYYQRNPEDPAAPLVGYAGRYDAFDAAGQVVKKQFVGNAYYNCAALEQYPPVLRHLVGDLAQRVMSTIECDAVIGAPMGGITTGFSLADELDIPFAFAEKKVKAVATAESREVAELTLNRFEIEPDWRVVLSEDVCNNFSTTEELMALVAQAGAKVVGVACLINRSMSVANRPDLPVIALREIPTEQFKQDDPAVAELVLAGQVIWKPKNDWPTLQALMDKWAA